MADPDKACLHPDFESEVVVIRLAPNEEQPPEGYYAEVKIRCIECSEPFRFTGVPAGLSPSRPTCSIDETELRIPVRPASADSDFGLGIPGFAVGWRRG